MIVYWDGLEYPFEVQEADILFIAGRVPVDRKMPLPFEHVALVAERRLVSNDADLLELRIYGLPESVDAQAPENSSTLTQTTGRYWLKDIQQGGQIGSETKVWNLGGRVESVDSRKAKHFGQLFSLLEGTSRFRFPGPFTVDATLTKNVKTNCLGFVCSFLEYFELVVLAHRYPRYTSPYKYSPASRTFPSPGHLAHALDLGVKVYPYKPTNRAEAQEFSRVDATLALTVEKNQAR